MSRVRSVAAALGLGRVRPVTAGSLQRVPVQGQPPTVAELAATFNLDVWPGSPAASPTPLTDVSHDSTRVVPGSLYVALPGSRAHGARYTGDAVAAGAVAVLTDPEGVALLSATLLTTVAVLMVDSPRLVLGPVSAAVQGDPGRLLSMFGVTGTNGKTTVSWMVHHLLRCVGVPAGLIGTVAVRVLDTDRPSAFTTPEAPDLQRMLHDMRHSGVDTVALEVSSHALVQHRVDGIEFDVVAFTNLSRDHLDFHPSMQDYLDAKLRLFTGKGAATGGVPARHAVVCIDDEAGCVVAEHARAAGSSVTTVAGRPGAAADVVIGRVTATPDGAQRFQLRGRLPSADGGAAGDLGTIDVDLPMPGRFNTVNAVIALCVVDQLLSRRSGTRPGMAELAGHLRSFPGVPGRMQRIEDAAAHGLTPLVVVDYAHTPDAVAAALRSLRAATRGRLVVVLGAGGDRDPGKRGPMGEAAAAAADVVVVTDDNPRGENPATIRAAVLCGATVVGSRRAGDVVEVADRAAAIGRALAACGGPDDTVLVCGKGHETGQQYGTGEPLPFDDRIVAAEALHEWAVEAALAPRGGERAFVS